MSRRTIVVLLLALVAIAACLILWYRAAPATPVAVLEPGQVADDFPYFPFKTSSEELSRLLNQAHRRPRDLGGGGESGRVCVVVVGGAGLMDPEATHPTLQVSGGQRLLSS